MRKPLVALASIAVLSLGLSACGGGGSSSDFGAPATPSSVRSTRAM